MSDRDPFVNPKAGDVFEYERRDDGSSEWTWAVLLVLSSDADGVKFARVFLPEGEHDVCVDSVEAWRDWTIDDAQGPCIRSPRVRRLSA